MASIWNDSTVEDTVRYIDETSWSNLNYDNLDAYTKGKALKEKAALRRSFSPQVFSAKKNWWHSYRSNSSWSYWKK